MDQPSTYTMDESILMNQNILADEISFDQAHFWHWFIALFRGFDEQKESNLDEAIQEVSGVDLFSKQISEWYALFLPTQTNLRERIYRVEINHELYIDIQFTQAQINYYLNELYIGNIGGHFEAWFFTLAEFQYFNLSDQHFLLLVPMLAVELKQSTEVAILIAKRLSMIKAFQGHEDYIAHCLLNGLIVQQDFYLDAEIGLCNLQNHSMRNLTQHLDDVEHIQELNQILQMHAG
jgi:hypothetical protein